ncbi:oxidoreductase [Actinocatenispora thailandica]|uniref:Oxidoreductase n=1 Tax=Actinocatenispora thailandica TaxID=227318 RepID=A0A7R7HWP3_9ACTN|nr:molybdopterin-dependent oxidoreductase [Actinocatenispora thailandica]BCJ34189.1 oxidoreductase [Actinocatenispora thailandica]
MFGWSRVRAAARRFGLGAVLGLVSAVLALGVGRLAAAFVRPESAPVIAVGNRFILLTPESLKDFAIRTFGQQDKTALLVGIHLVLAGYAIVVGVAGLRRRWLGVAGVAAFGAVGVLAAVTGNAAGPLDAVPSVLAAAAGIAGFLLLRRLLRRPLPVAGDGTGRSGGTDPDEATAGGTGTPGTDRRAVLQAAGGAAGLVVLGGAAGTAGATLQDRRYSAASSRSAVRIPAPAERAKPVPAGTELSVPGISPWRTANADFYRVDTALALPQVPADSWQLRVHGMVDHPLTLSYQDLLRRPLIERDITLSCVSNEVGGHLAGNARWIGARLAELLREAGVQRGASQLVSRSADGMTIGTPVETVLDGRDALLAVAMNGEPLPIAHGFPVRMLVPGLYGYVSACKWLVDLELTTFRAYDPYWVRRKWSRFGPVRTASRIDTPKPFGQVAPGTVTVAGVAWAQHRGIAGVEVRIDDGPWQRARLARTVDDDVWRQWSLRWQGATTGDHQLTVRATDGTGATQPQTRRTPFPRGATGWHSIAVTVTG